MDDVLARLAAYPGGPTSWYAADMRWLLDRLAEARATNTRLNRRCQDYEAGLAAKVAAHPQGMSLGRAFANAAATMYKAQRDQAHDAIRAFIAKWRVVEPHVSNAFALNRVHGMKYDGPMIVEELANLHACLPAETEEAQPTTPTNENLSRGSS